jgi:iron(III) transport system substrate-binding protein
VSEFAGKPEKKSFARHEMLSQFWLIWFVPLFAIAALIVATLVERVTRQVGSGVVVYAAQDQVYAEPILKDFEKQTGIKVRAIYDSEATKTVAIANRLLAERDHPQCDVYWGNEELRTRQLAAKQVFRETNGWAAFGYRSRRIGVALTNSTVAEPTALLELTNPVYRGKVAMAYPLFGSTATHLLALRQHWGAAAWENWCRAFAANKPFLVDGNSVAARMVSKGQVSVGLTDSDDIAAEIREGGPLKALPLSGESLLLPNTVGVTRHAPHPQAAQRLFEYLQSRAVAEQLVRAGALEAVQIENAPDATLKPDWDGLIRDLDSATATLQRVFLR